MLGLHTATSDGANVSHAIVPLELTDKIVVNSDAGLYPGNPLAVREAYDVFSEHLDKIDAYKLVSLNVVRF